MGEQKKLCGIYFKNITVCIAIMESIGSFMSLVLCAAYSEHPGELNELLDKNVLDFYPLPHILITSAVFSAIYCVCSILLIFGVETKRPLLFLPWLTSIPIVSMIKVILAVLLLIHYSHSLFMHVLVIILMSFAMIAGFFIQLLMVHVVYNYYKYLRGLNF